MTAPSKLLYLVTEDSYFLSHRLPMARAAQQAGLEVAVITNAGKHRSAIEKAGIRVIPLNLERRNLNPFRALRHVTEIAKIYRREKPGIVHHIAMKPVLYGALAAWITGVPRVINAFAGLGYVFTAETGLAKTLRPVLLILFRLVLRRPGSWLLLQNDDDAVLLKSYGVAPKDESHIVIIRGSGVELASFPEQAFCAPAPDFIAVYAGRMIGIKGLSTLKEAFSILKDRTPAIRLWLCGTPDPANPGSWTAESLTQWVSESNNVIYKGHCADMALIWAQAHLAVQPSWGGEGVPKSLLEAAASGRAIIATDVPGCRDMVRDGENGFLVPPRDAQALAQALERMTTDPARCRDMGRKSRALIESAGLSADAITSQTERLYRRLMQQSI